MDKPMSFSEYMAEREALGKRFSEDDEAIHKAERDAAAERRVGNEKGARVYDDKADMAHRDLMATGQKMQELDDYYRGQSDGSVADSGKPKSYIEYMSEREALGKRMDEDSEAIRQAERDAAAERRVGNENGARYFDNKADMAHQDHLAAGDEMQKLDENYWGKSSEDGQEKGAAEQGDEATAGQGEEAAAEQGDEATAGQGEEAAAEQTEAEVADQTEAEAETMEQTEAEQTEEAEAETAEQTEAGTSEEAETAEAEQIEAEQTEEAEAETTEQTEAEAGTSEEAEVAETGTKVNYWDGDNAAQSDGAEASQQDSADVSNSTDVSDSADVSGSEEAGASSEASAECDNSL